jgi:hypothetical protein
MDKKTRTWWNQLDGKWKNIFKEAINIDTEPSESELDKIAHLQDLNCSDSGLSDLEPLYQLTKFQRLVCFKTQISQTEKDKFKKALPNCILL